MSHAAPWSSINAIRALAMDAVEQANSGHPGTPMALAPAAYLLWTRFLRHAPTRPDWVDRDRFVLSCGHASMLQYALLHLTGYPLSLDDLKAFRQWGSPTAGHPERGHTVGVEVTTGPLGQGLGNAVGLALAQRLLAARFNRPGHAVVGHRVWGFVSDGDLMEGVAAEAASLAGHLGVSGLTLIWDDNHITIDGATDLSFSEDVGRRFEAYGWRVIRVGGDDGNDLQRIEAALREAAAEAARPVLVTLRTIIADPAPTKRNTPESHGAPLGRDEVARTRAAMGWPDAAFHVPPEAYADLGACRARGEALVGEWQARHAAWAAEHPDLAREFDAWMAGQLPAGWEDVLPVLTPERSPLATREASALALQALAGRIENLVGGSADLAGSTGVKLPGLARVTRGEAGRLVSWGVREHGMAAVCNGLAAHGGLRPFASTFLVFADYMKGAMRLSALMRLPVVYIGTHDSIGVGEDGPTHQPIEQLAMLRATPNTVVLRPADATETVEAWRAALRRDDGPTVLVLTRQKLPVLDRTVLAPAEGVHRGAYVLREAPGGAPAALLLATGSEVHVALAAADLLAADGIAARVVSMPSWELFAGQPAAYREAVLPAAVSARVAIEAASPLGWHRWVGPGGAVLAMEGFGASAPADRLYAEFGITPARAAALARGLLGRS